MEIFLNGEKMDAKDLGEGAKYLFLKILKRQKRKKSRMICFLSLVYSGDIITIYCNQSS